MIQVKLSDEYIQKVVVSGNAEHNQTIVLKPYDENWPVLFEREKQRISTILKDKALMIEHIGSTSVPGLIAKPIIDILLVVEDAGKEEDYVDDLVAHGYILRIKEPDFENHHMFLGPDTDIHLHVFSQDSKEIEKYLLFRNYLRNHQEAKEFYANTKKALAKKKWKYVQNYADAKSDVVQQIMDAARKEKQSN
ncbi:GrpB family protein [Clostridium sp. C1]|nr:GrpB family protein [Clostridium sp. C1]